MESQDRFSVWAPRILSLLFVLFLMLFSLDIFTVGASTGEIAIGLLLHNIPALVLLIAVIISWKYEIVGGIVFVLAGIAYTVLLLLPGSPSGERLLPALIIALPAIVVGVLFIRNWTKKN